jgi:hypothetical protein
MRYLLCTVLALVACERRDTARDTTVGDTAGADATPAADTVMARDTVKARDTVRSQTMSAVPDRLLGSWTAKGYDAGSSRAQPFTMTWSRTADGSLAGTVSFEGGEKYNVKIVSTGDSTFVYESEPHQSPTLKARVVTRTRARLVGDTLSGTYEARARGGKALKGQFTATRGS